MRLHGGCSGNFVVNSSKPSPFRSATYSYILGIAMSLHGGCNGHSVVNRSPPRSVQLTYSYISCFAMRLHGGCNGNFVVNRSNLFPFRSANTFLFPGTAMRLHGGCNGHFVVNRSPTHSGHCTHSYFSSSTAGSVFCQGSQRKLCYSMLNYLLIIFFHVQYFFTLKDNHLYTSSI